MELRNLHVVLTGATGGLGSVLALALSARGAVVGLVGRDPVKLHVLQKRITSQGGKAHIIVADLAQPNMASQVLTQSLREMGHVDLLMNNAGIIEFTEFAKQAEVNIDNMIHTNVTATLVLSREFVTYFSQRGRGHLAFVGSIFGSLGFPHFATYCASKFAIHGFSQALRRELIDSNIGVTYIAPRAIATPMNDDRTNAMWQASGQAIDEPPFVADKIIQALLKDQQELFIGQPQSFFAWLNGVVPRLVNLGLKQQARLAKRFL